MSKDITNPESSGAVAQSYVATGMMQDRVPAIPISNPAKVSDNAESDIAPAVSSPPGRALTRRSMFMGIAVPALTGATIAPAAAAGILTGPDPIFAMITRIQAIMA